MIRKMDVFRRPSAAKLDNASCHPIMWARFNSRRSYEGNGALLYENQILNNIVSHSFSAGSNHLLAIEQLAVHAKVPISIEHVHEELTTTVLPCGRVMFGFVGNMLDQIVRNYPDFEWWISDKGLNIGPAQGPETSLSGFDQIAGELMIEARSRHEGKYLPQAAYEQIAAKLDDARLRPLDYIAGQAHSDLAKWNQKNPKKAMKTFRVAIRKAQPKGLERIPRAVKRRLYQSVEKLSNHNP